MAFIFQSRHVVNRSTVAWIAFVSSVCPSALAPPTALTETQSGGSGAGHGSVGISYFRDELLLLAAAAPTAVAATDQKATGSRTRRL